MTDYRKQLAAITGDAGRAQNTDFLGSDFQLNRAGNLARISLAVSSAVKVKLIPSSGTGFYINGGAALTAATLHTEEVALDQGRTWNLQTDDVSGTSVLHLAVHEVQA